MTISYTHCYMFFLESIAWQSDVICRYENVHIWYKNSLNMYEAYLIKHSTITWLCQLLCQPVIQPHGLARIDNVTNNTSHTDLVKSYKVYHMDALFWWWKPTQLPQRPSHHFWKPCCLYLNHSSHCICYMHIIYMIYIYMQISNKYRWIPLDSSTCPHLSQVIGGSWQILRKSLHNQRVGLWNAPHMRADSSRLKYGTSSSSWRLSSWTVRFCLLQKHKESEF